MPEMDGLELIKALKAMDAKVGVIAISGYSKFSEPLNLPMAKRMGASRILAKPVSPEVLLQVVDDVLSKILPRSPGCAADPDLR